MTVYCQHCGQGLDLNISNYAFREMMLERPDQLKILLGEWRLKAEEDVINLYCPNCGELPYKGGHDAQTI